MIICIDAGHGGKDPGAVGQRGTKEKDINLYLAQQIYKRLKGSCEVIITREKDKYVGLLERTAIANEAKAVLFISIHCNSSENEQANGIEIIHHLSSRTGQKLADTIMDHLLPATGLRNRGVKSDQRGLAVLRQTTMPAVIIEVGFISNWEEEKLMQDRDWLNGVAGAVSKGIKKHLGE